jgi:hypothetical protein
MLGIHDLAKQMLAAGFTGQGLWDESKAQDYIIMAAANPEVEQELPPSGFGFWRACHHQFKIWKARRMLGLPER